MKRLIAWSVAHSRFVLAATLIVLALGFWAVRTTSVDAIPDLSDVQVIVMTEWPGQAPQLVEDQITYPLQTELLKVPHTKVVRGMSQFGLSAIYAGGGPARAPGFHFQGPDYAGAVAQAGP